MFPFGAASRAEFTLIPPSDSNSPSHNHYHFGRVESFGSQLPQPQNNFGYSRGPISPPPLKRFASITPAGKSSASPTPSDSASLANGGVENVRDMARFHGDASGAMPSPHQSPPATSTQRERVPGVTSTPKAQTAAVTNQSAGDVAKRLKDFSQEVRNDHATLVAYCIESTQATERRVFHGRDLFADLKIAPVPETKGETMKIKFKQHIKTKRDQPQEHYRPVCISTDKDAVPSYRFHHVEIKKNVLTPNTMLTFVPHLRDLESSEEVKYNLWLKELEDIDLKSGFKPMNRDEKHLITVESERAATLSLYLDGWLSRLAMPHCNKSTLIRYMASHESDDAMTPQQKTDIIKSNSGGNVMTLEAQRAAEMFTSAFQLAFKDGLPPSKRIDLRKVLLLDETVDSVLENKSAAKDVIMPQPDNEFDMAEFHLATYCLLGCLICFSHSCDHGEFDNQNIKRTFSLSSCSPLSDLLRKRHNNNADFTNDAVREPCQRKCHLLGIPSETGMMSKVWSREERRVLRTMYVVAETSKFGMDPICLAAEFLNRDCCDVSAELHSLNISFPEPEPSEPARPRNISWYDRRRKMLLGDWQDHTVTHEHQRREVLEPCFHEGPCAPKICSCVDAGILCEKFCGCSVEECAYKFTGCACHMQGKSCYAKQKDRPCVCIQLNRECDPDLCDSCGAIDRADPLNAEDDDLHSSGCQNCDLQRGLHKGLLLGQSQLEGVGYGLFTAEDIAQDEFIIEYVGELITHDEGVRREARRGDVFDEESNISYVFTLLENEGTWVDAAIYGNLSRYINHASENDTKGCNITPRILYVNGEFRIKFTALRDIRAGEELFFNYGENFPNLTKKLLDHKAGEKPDTMKKPGRPRRVEAGDRVARKAPKPEQRKVGRPKTKKKSVEPGSDEESEVVRALVEASKTRKRKRRVLDDSEEEEYHPTTATDATSHAAESGIDSEDVLLGSARLRKRHEIRRPKEGETPSKSTRGQPKIRSKRGGARPGSGRPRKHPRPEPALPAKPSIPTSNPVTPTKKPVRKPEASDPIEIEDSEDPDVVVRNRTSRTRRLPAKFRGEVVWGQI